MDDITSFLIVCPMVFLAGFIDAIGGGGGLISLPAYIFAGLPMHAAAATNKLSAATGILISTTRLCRHAKIDFKLVIPAVCLAITGATAGSQISMLVNEKILKQMLLIVLPVAAFFCSSKKCVCSGTKKKVQQNKDPFGILDGSGFNRAL